MAVLFPQKGPGTIWRLKLAQSAPWEVLRGARHRMVCTTSAPPFAHFTVGVVVTDTVRYVTVWYGTFMAASLIIGCIIGFPGKVSACGVFTVNFRLRLNCATRCVSRLTAICG